jgi:hypothetical protein
MLLHIIVASVAPTHSVNAETAVQVQLVSLPSPSAFCCAAHPSLVKILSCMTSSLLL